MKESLIKLTILLCSVFAVLPPANAQGGIALGSTRVVYPADSKQVSLSVNNSSRQERYLINSWVSDQHDKKSKDFIVTPPLFVSEPSQENTLRIMYIGKPLPADKETLFYLNVKAIPSVDKKSVENKNVLQLAVLSSIKLFVRPAGLPVSPEDAPAMLRFSRRANSLTVHNASPYFVTLVNLKFAGQPLSALMVAPGANGRVSLPKGKSGKVTFQTINDYGALSSVQTGVMQ
ncbi:fimbrial chaperone protein FimC [Izhakiella australiensis]|uniref:Fimbrial chaperone protein FimC n=1 Tax=Izhakiella australiensis TaxID=1926881 RepID=A0A1S8YN00_9GAMM|nr:fimbria/pilus periplasmic chaperone [Izhakiella australiensis]OON40531.1 fimbrial chaperone protein FimC [Izhakiella australiensis]